MAASRLSSLSALDHLRLNGCALPIRVLPNQPFHPDKPDTLLDLFLAFRSKVEDANISTPSQETSRPPIARDWSNLRFRSHLFLPWLNELLFCPRRNVALVKAAAAALCSEDLVVWSTDWVVKDGLKSSNSSDEKKRGTSSDTPATGGGGGGHGQYFSWHQDSTYSGFSGDDAITFWVAFGAVTAEMGPLQYRVGTHALGQLRHEERPEERAEGNMLAFGQTIPPSSAASGTTATATTPAWDDDSAFPIAVAAPLAPGEASIHNFSLVHKSGVNTTKEPRVGLAIRVARADAFAKIDKFRDRGSNKEGLWERVSPLSCADCATLEKEFEATAGSAEGNRSRWTEEMCNQWTERLHEYFAEGGPTKGFCFEAEPTFRHPKYRASKNGEMTFFGVEELAEWDESMFRELSAYGN